MIKGADKKKEEEKSHFIVGDEHGNNAIRLGGMRGVSPIWPTVSTSHSDLQTNTQTLSSQNFVSIAVAMAGHQL